jgi:2-polyprenyl-3-methyl-5-hydroxy-6-metoxy-1,4-benzoquinol methylase
MRCAPGTHEAAFALLTRHLDPCGGVLDLGAGSGAFLARLEDAGFRDLHAVEHDTPRFELEGVTPIRLDLNEEFVQRLGRRYRLLIAIEIIEHLESPTGFLRQAWQLLEDDGFLLISTPNLASWLGRLKFLLQGELLFFDPKVQGSTRHRSPLPDSVLRTLLTEEGFGIIESTTAGDFAGPLQKLAAYPARLLFRAVYGPRVVGDTYILLARKAGMGDSGPA